MNYVLQIIEGEFVSIPEFAKILGIDASHLYRLASQKHFPNRRTIRTIAEGLVRVIHRKDWKERIENGEWKRHASRIQGEIIQDKRSDKRLYQKGSFNDEQ